MSSHFRSLCISLLLVPCFVFISGCLGSQDPRIALYANYDPNEISFSVATLDLMKKLYQQNNGQPVKVSLVVTDPNFAPPIISDCLRPSAYYICDYVSTNVNPDIIVRVEAGQWTNGLVTPGYEAIHTRLGYLGLVAPYTQNGWRQIELNDTWKDTFPEYFTTNPSTGKSIAVAGHMRTFQYNNNLEVFNLVANAINAQNTDYVFALGDFISSNRPEEYANLKTHFFDVLDPNAPAYYVPGNHEAKNIRILTEGPDYVDADLFWTWTVDNNLESQALINTGNENVISIDSSANFQVVQQRLIDAANDPNFDPGMPTILMTHHKIWNIHWWDAGADFVSPGFDDVDIMPLLSGVDPLGFPATPILMVDAIIDGDAGPYITQNTLDNWNGIERLSVGSGSTGDNTSIYFAVVSIDSYDHSLRVHKFFVDLPRGHSYYNLDATGIPSGFVPTNIFGLTY